MIHRTSPFITIHDHHKLPNHHPPFIQDKNHHPTAWSTCLERVCKIFLTWSSQVVIENVGWSDMRSSSRNCCSNNRTFETAMSSCFVICGVLLLYYYYIYIQSFEKEFHKRLARKWEENKSKCLKPPKHKSEMKARRWDLRMAVPFQAT